MEMEKFKVALDVLNNEAKDNFFETSDLVKYAQKNENIIITPHIGGVTKESWEKQSIILQKGIVECLKQNIKIFKQLSAIYSL